MAHDILQRFLTAKLFDVSGDDSRLNKLREAGEDLASLLKAAPSRASIFTMVAIDARVPSDEPILSEVAALLEKRWHSYAGAFSSSTLPVVARAIILDALSRCMTNDPVALAVALTARSFLPLIGSQSDQALWTDLIDDAEKRLETRARREWALPSSTPDQSTALEMPAVAEILPPTIKRDWLTEKISAAVGPTNSQGTATSGNPHWPNSPEAWSYEFAPRVAKAVADSLDLIAKALTERVNAQAGAAASAEAISKFITDVGGNLTQTSIGLERRTSLLWWKEALYSPSLRASYRSVEPALAACWLAVDATEITGPFAPRMMEAFLVETLLGLDPTATSPVKAADLFGVIVTGTAPAAVQLRAQFALVTAGEGRSPLAAALGRLSSVNAELFDRHLGLPADIKITPADMSVWLFRDLQAARATESKKRRGK